MLLVESYLVLHRLFFRSAQRTKIHLITQDAEGRHVEAGLDVRLSESLVVWRCRDMGSHGACRIGIGCSALDSCPAAGIRVVACPDLRHEAEDSQIEAVAARGTALEQDLREFPD